MGFWSEDGFDIDAFLYADRGIYRPGETVRLTALVRDRLARAVDGRKGYLVVKRPSGVEFKKIAFQRTPTGALTQDIVLPATAPRGPGPRPWTTAASGRRRRPA